MLQVLFRQHSTMRLAPQMKDRIEKQSRMFTVFLSHDTACWEVTGLGQKCCWPHIPGTSSLSSPSLKKFLWTTKKEQKDRQAQRSNNIHECNCTSRERFVVQHVVFLLRNPLSPISLKGTSHMCWAVKSILAAFKLLHYMKERTQKWRHRGTWMNATWKWKSFHSVCSVRLFFHSPPLHVNVWKHWTEWVIGSKWLFSFICSSFQFKQNVGLKNNRIWVTSHCDKKMGGAYPGVLLATTNWAIPQKSAFLLIVDVPCKTRCKSITNPSPPIPSLWNKHVLWHKLCAGEERKRKNWRSCGKLLLI